MANLARAGVGYALLPSDQHGQGLLPVLKVPEGEAALWLLTHPDLRGVTRIKVVWDAIADYCEALRH
jgi:DNA-binding transcriptional LysR family regulator